MRRSISPFPLLFTSISAILGSGWLFAIFYTSKYAGASSLLSWVIGGIAIAFISFVFAELCTMLPITGSSTRIPQYTHGTIVSFLFSWMIWLSYVALVPTEVQAVLQYLSYFFDMLAHEGGGLTRYGYIAATILMLFISTLNIYSLRWLLRCNNALTVMKIIIPLIISITILIYFFTPHGMIHPVNSAFTPFGFQGVFSAISSGGIVFAFNGFKQACEIAGEAKNPNKAIPFAIIGSISICLIIFLLLQTAFLTSLIPRNLAEGWKNLHIQGENSPLASIVAQDNILWLLPILYLGAVIGPLAAGLMYAGSSSRSLYGMSTNGYIPLLFQHLTGQGNPVFAIITNFVIGMCMFAPLPGWDKMITFLTSLMAITYAVGPITLMALRKQAPDQKRPFRLPFGFTWSAISFYLCTLFIYWSGWDIISKLGIGFLAGFICLFSYHFLTERGRKISLHWKSSIWIWPYFIGITIISYLGSFEGGMGIITFGWDFLALGILSLITVWLSIIFRLPSEITKRYIANLNLDKRAASE